MQHVYGRCRVACDIDIRVGVRMPRFGTALSRAPHDHPPQHDRAMPASHEHRPYRQKNRLKPKNSVRDRNERQVEPSSVSDTAGDRKNVVIPVIGYDTATKSFMTITQVLLAVRAAAHLYMVDSGGWVSG